MGYVCCHQYSIGSNSKEYELSISITNNTLHGISITHHFCFHNEQYMFQITFMSRDYVELNSMDIGMFLYISKLDLYNQDACVQDEDMLNRLCFKFNSIYKDNKSYAEFDSDYLKNAFRNKNMEAYKYFEDFVPILNEKINLCSVEQIKEYIIKLDGI